MIRFQPIAALVSGACLLLTACNGGSNSGGAVPTPVTTTISLSATTLTLTTTVGAPVTQTLTVTSTGTASVAFTSVAISGTSAASFAQTNTCGTAISTTCSVSVVFNPTAAGSAAATLTLTDTASGSPQTVALSGTATAPNVSYTLGVSPTQLTFPGVVGLTATAPVTLSATGTGNISLQGNTVSGANASLFTQSASTCGSIILAGTSCTVTLSFTPTGSGTQSASFNVADNALAGGTGTATQTVSLAATTTATPTTANTVDCSTTAGSMTGGACTAVSLSGDPIAAGGFHGYADPSLRKDPNASLLYLGYSWARTLVDGTHVVELHLASSTNGGTSFTEIGTLWPTTTVTQTSSTAYSQTNYSSHEVVDLIPISLTGSSAGQTMWVQAHEEYLVAPQQAIYAQRDPTLYVSVSAVQVATPASLGTALLGLNGAPEAHLGAVSVDPTRSITQSLSGLSSSLSKCATFGQPALWYQSPYLYLALECGESATLGADTNELAHYLFYTTPTGADATKWTWSYLNELATPAQAAALGRLEGTSYSFFTEPEFVQSRSGQLLMILTPGVFDTAANATQPVIQYGCRTVPVTLNNTSGGTLATDTTTNVLSYTAKLTENDLYIGPNEGPAACTYDPSSTLGLIMGRKYENDPTYGFYIYPVSSGINP